MIGTPGSGNDPGERTWRTNSGAVDARHFPVEQHDVGRDRADHLESDRAVAGFVDLGAADGEQQRADDLAGIVLVVDDQDLDRPAGRP